MQTQGVPLDSLSTTLGKRRLIFVNRYSLHQRISLVRSQISCLHAAASSEDDGTANVLERKCLASDNITPSAKQSFTTSEKQDFMQMIGDLKSVWPLMVDRLSELEVKRLLWTICSIVQELVAHYDNVDVIVNSFSKSMNNAEESDCFPIRVEVLINLLPCFQRDGKYNRFFATILKDTLLMIKHFQCPLNWPRGIDDLIKNILEVNECSAREKFCLLVLLDDIFTQNQDNSTSLKICHAILQGQSNHIVDGTAPDTKRVVLKAIRLAIQDKSTYVFDHWLALNPVKAIEGELAHRLLLVFVSGDIHDYLTLYEENKDKFEQLKLNHEDNIGKMRLLTFVKLADRNKEIDFVTLKQEIALDSEDEIEPFVIDAIRNKLISCLIDLNSKKIIVNQVMLRSVTKIHWKSVLEEIHTWMKAFDDIHNQMVASPASS